jgi:hypothetical protein
LTDNGLTVPFSAAAAQSAHMNAKNPFASAKRGVRRRELIRWIKVLLKSIT